MEDIPKNTQTVPLHKVYYPEAYGTATDPYVIGRPFYGEANSVCSQTYMVVGYDPVLHNFSENECQNIVSYMTTRFFRYLVSIKKKTQHTPRDVFQFVPLQDFSKSWNDEELYNKYGLDLFEREYIESLIKPME
jgi:site-specific DNA-methyltransferase (adenine-specific)